MTSQDLRTPLRGINHLVEWIEEDMGQSATEELREHLRLLRDRTRRLERTIHALHQYARVGEIPSNASTVNIRVMVETLSRKIDPEQKVAIDVGDLPTLVAARGLLQRAFQGLLENAIEHHREEDGTILVRARELDDEWEFCVVTCTSDAESPEDAFERLQVEPGRAEDAIDLGLMLVRRIVEDQGGTTIVRLGAGNTSSTTFTWPKGGDA